MYINFDRLLVLCFGFLVLFIAYDSAQNLSGHVLEENGFGNMGFYSLSALYLVFGVSCLFALSIVKAVGTKFCLVIGSLCYTAFTGCFIMPALSNQNPDFSVGRSTIKWTVILGGAVCGFGASILWVAAGQYISQCASDKTKGTFFGVF